MSQTFAQLINGKSATVEFSTGSASTPSVAFSGDTNTGIYSPGADQVAISTGGSGRLFVNSNGDVSVGTTSTSGFGRGISINGTTFSYYDLYADGSIYGRVRAAANEMALLAQGASSYLLFGQNNTERMRLTSTGLGVGTSTFSYLANKLVIDKGSTANDGITIVSSNTSNASIWFADGTTGAQAYAGGIYYDHSLDKLSFYSGGSTNVHIDSSGRLGIGTTAPNCPFVVAGGSGLVSNFTNQSDADFNINCTSGVTTIGPQTGVLALKSSNTERARIDSSGRLLVGTSSSISNVYVGGSAYQSSLQIAGNAAGYQTGLALLNYHVDGYAPTLSFGTSRNSTLGSNTLATNNTDLGIINFTGNDGTNFRSGAYIIASVDGTSGSADLPTRLTFWTTADGASSPTERMRIEKAGSVGIGTVNTTTDSYLNVITSSAPVAYFNRTTNDGTIIQFRQDSVDEGSISVSGNTVTLNGAHLSRWSQLPSVDNHDKSVRPEILRGTVMSNLDEMCEWINPTSGGAQANPQLNKTKISDVEGDNNVAGIFQSWDDDDDTWVNDYYLAMTGDFIIRIAADVTVERGDLLMSAGDGTAKPQDDDIIRSKTIAKVTSTNVSCTYDDGSYCVPCVLMAC